MPKALKAKGQNFNGTWEIVELNVDNQDLARWNPRVWVIDGETVTAYHRKPGGDLKPWEPHVMLTLVRPDGGGADEIDYLRHDGISTSVLKGRMKVDGDELTFCYANSDQPRPSGYATGEGLTFERYKRVNAK